MNVNGNRIELHVPWYNCGQETDTERKWYTCAVLHRNMLV